MSLLPRSVVFAAAALLAGCTSGLDSSAGSGAGDASIPLREAGAGGAGAGGTSAPDLGAGDNGGCGLRTCASAGATCGPIGDGCGGIIHCGDCTGPQTCGGGGVPSVCGGNMGCVPKTCAQLDFNCGPAGDGCGNRIQCGTCPQGQSCGGGGFGRCGVLAGGGGGDAGMPMLCAPTTCAKLGFNCGPAGDGCGGMLDCGQCPNGQACGTQKPGVCGPTNQCVPRTCAQLGFNCGLAGDGCGGVINCGSCNAPSVCGGGGVPNQCGGGNNNGGGGGCVNLCLQQMQCNNGATTTVTGTVYAPTDPNLGYGQPDPLYGALVYVPNGQVMPFAPGVSCDKCGASASGSPLVSTESGADGTFTLANVPCGNNVPLVIQIGRWRRQVVIPNVACCANTALPASLTRLPRNHNEGDIPLIAVVTGRADPIECVLPKIGIDQSEYSLPNGTGRVRFYVDNGATFGQNTPGVAALIASPTELAKYDAIILDCPGMQEAIAAQSLQNLVDYTSAGGRLFASHFSYSYLYNNGPFAGTANWNVDQMHPPDLTAFVDTSFPKGMAFASWLKTVGASLILGQIPVQQVRHDFDAVIPPSQRWLYADPMVSANNPLEYTFNTPVGALPANQCGRVLFSDFHVNTGGKGSGPFPGECGNASPMTPQEKVLEYMIFDLTSCVQPDVPPPPMCTPRTCRQQNANCGPVGDGCGNIIMCGSCPMGQTCGGGGVPSQCGGIMCMPITCAQQNVNCGPAGNGCGGALDCGTCPIGQTCGGGGVPGQCGASDLALACVPRTCAQQNINCGPAGDGCGGALDCGPCPMGQTCGGGGVPGQCGAPNCTKRTCAQANANCGFIGDGCGGVIDCGTCPAPQTCGGGGIPNQCGGVG